jgi:hypothetical protein
VRNRCPIFKRTWLAFRVFPWERNKRIMKKDFDSNGEIPEEE